MSTKRFQYTQVQAPRDPLQVLNVMNNLGQDGWEVFFMEGMVRTDPEGKVTDSLYFLYARRELP